MSDHSDHPHPETDITDFYVFQKPADPAKSILILNVNPNPTPESAFDPKASYEFKIDTNDDAQADIAFHVLFSAPNEGRQTASVYRLEGNAAHASGEGREAVIRNAPVSFDDRVHVTTGGSYRLYAGLRSDPWFADVPGFLDNFQFTGQDTFAERNVFSIVLEVPNHALGSKGPIHLWGRTAAPEDGTLTVADQVGRPLMNAVVAQAEGPHFNHTPPAEQRDVFQALFVSRFQGFGYEAAEAIRIASELLPDILRYDPMSSAGFPNGRKPTDDGVDWILGLITNGRVTDDLLGAHTDFLDDFPYLGPPHAGITSE